MESIAQKPEVLVAPQRAAPQSVPPRRPVQDMQDFADWRTGLNHPAMAAVLRIAKLVLRGLIFFAFAFIEIVAELLAPAVLILGIGWGVLPTLLSLVATEGQSRDIVNSVIQSIPQQLHFGHTTLTPSGLVVDGLLLIAVVALCRTIQTIVTFDV